MTPENVIDNIKARKFSRTRPNLEPTRTEDGDFYFKGVEYLDSPENHQRNLELLPRDWYYRDNKVYYNVNSLGYRAKEFDAIDWNNSIVVFGCSNVYGVGLEERYTISSLIEAETGIPTVNMGIAGGSVYRNYNDSLLLAEKGFTPKAVAFVWSDWARATIYEKNRVNNIGSWSRNGNNTFGDLWCKDKTNANAHVLFTAMAARKVWQPVTKYAEASFFNRTAQLLNCPMILMVDKGRDEMHPGIESAKIAAKILLRELNL